MHFSKPSDIEFSKHKSDDILFSGVIGVVIAVLSSILLLLLLLLLLFTPVEKHKRL